MSTACNDSAPEQSKPMMSLNGNDDVVVGCVVIYGKTSINTRPQPFYSSAWKETQNKKK